MSHRGLRSARMTLSFSAAMFWAEGKPFALDESIHCFNPIVSYIIFLLYHLPVNMSHVHRVTISFSAALSWAEAQRCAFETIAFTHLHRFMQAFLQPPFNSSWHLLAASGRVVQHGIHEESPVTLCMPTPWIWRWCTPVSLNQWLSSDVPCLINSPFRVLFKSLPCWRKVFHLIPFWANNYCFLYSFIDMAECWCSLIHENNISLFRSSHQYRHLACMEHELTERSVFCCWHYQLGKSMMERMGGTEQEPCVRLCI